MVKVLVNLLTSLRDYIASVVDYNAVLYLSQNGTPSTSAVLDGQMLVWKDADATMGNPTHFLVYNDGGTIVTFASVETVP